MSSIISFLIGAVVLVIIYSRFNSKLNKMTTELQLKENEINDLSNRLSISQESLEISIEAHNYDNKYNEARYDKLLSQKKSSEVRLGQISEQIAPFTDDWPYDPKNFRFLGSPIDGISFNFDTDEIVFMEIKSGLSKVSGKQKAIREMIESAKVKFVTFRVDKDGSKIEKEYAPKG